MTLRPLVLALALLACCGGTARQAASPVALESLRAQGEESTDGEVVGRWALGEMYAPGGTAERAQAARKRLEAIDHRGTLGSLARAVYDEAHGDPRSAAAAYVDALMAASKTAAPETPLVGWFGARHLLGLRGSVADLFKQNRAAFDALLARPGNIGWRAVAELEDWRALEVYDRGEQTGDAYDAEVERRMGCARGIRIAGPFGHGVASDRLNSYPAEQPTPWPVAWKADEMRGSVPRVLSVARSRCLAAAEDQVQPGLFYAQTFFVTRGDRELVVAAQGAIDLWVDDRLVLSRGAEQWGSWQRFGAHLSVGAGRHRVLARILTPAASVRLLNPDGTGAGLETDGDDHALYSGTPPVLLPDPNPLEPFVRAAIAGDAALGASPLTLALAAFDAFSDQAHDVAATLIDPLVSPPNAAPLALELASAFAAGDPAFSEDTRTARARALRTQALERDPRLWESRMLAILDDAEQRGPSEGVDPLRKLAEEVPAESEILGQLARLYGRLGWRSDQVRALADLAARFPDDTDSLRAYLDVLDEVGPLSEADRIAARIKKLDPDAEVDLDRALARHDYKAAVAELEKLQKRRPDRKDLAAKIADVLARSGDPSAAAAQIEKALAKNPRDAEARFRLADRAYAKGDTGALRRAVAVALQTGASDDELRAAIDLLEGATDLEPFRIDGRAIIRDYMAWERAGHHMDGTAARVLDYAATWVHDDGSSEMLEHEIQKIQSEEAINAESETSPPPGLVLHLRVIKPDGRVLEPDPVAGKPTLTMPHLEVGDFLEVEHITPQAGDGAKGRSYQSPHWFFREADKGYWRSEFVVVTPSDRELEVETRGNVQPPVLKPLGRFVERHWRVDLSPPAVTEPASAPITEFLPSVRVGWGVSLESMVAKAADAVIDETPLDPRLRVKALEMVRGTPESMADDRARLVYRWVLDHVQDGKDNDGRHAVTGGTGSRQAAFRYLLRLLGIECRLAIVKNRLAAPPLGKMSEVEQYDAIVMRLTTERGPRWLTVHDKFAPYGYVPAELREQPAIVLSPGTPRELVRAPGAVDGVRYEARAILHDDGSAAMELACTFSGNRGIAWRNALDQVAQAKLHDFVERELVAPSFAGGHVRDMKAEGANRPDEPLVVRLQVEVPELAKMMTGGALEVQPPFAPRLAQLAALPERHTPMIRPSHWYSEVHMQVVLPQGMKPPADMARGEARDEDAVVTVKDSASDGAIQFDRVIDLPAGRVEPGEQYAKWQKFVRDADALLGRELRVGR
jgi:tetratricopeptide (TPR) repeat protein